MIIVKGGEHTFYCIVNLNIALLMSKVYATNVQSTAIHTLYGMEGVLFKKLKLNNDECFAHPIMFPSPRVL
jgi:hypothetical protein